MQQKQMGMLGWAGLSADSKKSVRGRPGHDAAESVVNLHSSFALPQNTMDPISVEGRAWPVRLHGPGNAGAWRVTLV